MRYKRILMIMYTYSSIMHLTKDPCSYVYYLAKNHGWDASYAYFAPQPIHDEDYERYCHLVYLGAEEDFGKEIIIGKDYCREHADEIDVLMLFNYGHSTYRTADFIKKYNKNVVVYSKLDMSDGGFKHFYDGTLLRKIKNINEVFKSRNVDFFTVENHYYYEILKNVNVFKNKIAYLPNCVSLLHIPKDFLALSDGSQKENIILTVARIGEPEKNVELLIKSLQCVDRKLLDDWKICLVGPVTSEFSEYVASVCDKDDWIKGHVHLIGAVNDRFELYKWYNKSRVFCMTSRSESFCIASVEAMYFGVYPVLTDYGSIAYDVTGNKKYGSVVVQNDPFAFAAEIGQAVQKCNHEGSSLCTLLTESARQRFNYEKWAAVLNEHLSGLVGAKM